MYSQVFSSVFLALCLAQGILAVPAPLQITHAPITTTGGVPDQEETENLARLKTAEADANRHLKKMEHVLNNPTVPENAELIEAAFGKNAQVDKIKNTVQKLQTGQLPVILPTDKTIPFWMAWVKFDKSTNPPTLTNTHFGKAFHSNKESDNMRAATLVHEATHKLAHTGDLVDQNNRMILAGDIITPKSGRKGYASQKEPAKTPAELNEDPKWTALRDGNAEYPPVADLHNNAESYAQFGSICDFAISNAAAGALEERDWETVAIHLIRRKACAIRRPKSSPKQPASPRTNSRTQTSPLGTKKLPRTRPVASKQKGIYPGHSRTAKASTTRSTKKISKGQGGRTSKSRILVTAKKHNQALNKRPSTSLSRIPQPRPVMHSAKPQSHPTAAQKSSIPRKAVGRKQQLAPKIPVSAKRVRRNFRI